MKLLVVVLLIGIVYGLLLIDIYLTTSKPNSKK